MPQTTSFKLKEKTYPSPLISVCNFTKTLRWLPISINLEWSISPPSKEEVVVSQKPRRGIFCIQIGLVESTAKIVPQCDEQQDLDITKTKKQKRQTTEMYILKMYHEKWEEKWWSNRTNNFLSLRQVTYRKVGRWKITSK